MLGYLMTDVYAGVPIGFLVAAASSRWQGLRTFVLGLLTVAPVLGVVGLVTGHDVSAGTILVGALYFAVFAGIARRSHLRDRYAHPPSRVAGLRHAMAWDVARGRQTIGRPESIKR